MNLRCRKRLHIVLHEVSRLHAPEGTEIGRWRDHIDVVVQFLWQGVAEGSDDVFTGFGVVVDVVFGTKHALSLRNADAKSDPFASRSTFY